MMKTYIGLLRGINVGGHKKIKMADLRAHLGEVGLMEVQTYIQSGNIVFKSSIEDTAVLSKTIQDMIFTNFGFEVPVVILKSEDLERALIQNPFKEQPIETFCFTFLSDHPLMENIENLNSINYPEEKFKLIGKTVFMYLPNGFARAKLSNNLFEKKLKVSATTRNWKTVNKLIELSI